MQCKRPIIGLLVFLCALISFQYSCTGKNDYLKIALKAAGDNRPELEAVLEHYKDYPEKLAAAKFLIENMPAHRSYKGDEIHQYYEIAKDVLASGLSPVEQRDSLLVVSDNMFPGLEDRTVSDIRIIKSDFLIRSIDQAFDEWKNRPWAQHVTFDQFCEWLLPYKAVEMQEMDSWRDTLSTFFTWGLNNMVHDDDTYETTFNAVHTVRNEINWRIKPYGLFNRNGYRLLSADLYHHQTFGNCLDYVTLAVLTYRSVGIPCVIDETPYWGRFRAGHSWYTVLNNRGEELTSEWDVSSIPGRAFFTDKRIPKVYRNTYAINRDRQKYLKESAYKHPFKMCQKDVTSDYFNTSDLEIPIFKNIRLAEKYVYIATFTGMDTDWSVVDFGMLRHGKACFHDMGRNIMYIVLGFDGILLQPISKPFILHTNGDVEFITCDTTQIRSVDIRRKYYQSNNVAKMRKRLLGGQIQCSKTADFKNPTILYTIDDLNIPDKIPVTTDQPYRYWRYLSPNGSYGSIAELAFFDVDEVLLKGTPISNTSDSETVSRAYDGDWLSNFETGQSDGNWIGMDLGIPKSVAYVRIVPRSDDNDIHPGDVYEMRYWNSNNRWTSCGTQMAKGNTLHYDNIPKGALMWVSDLTRGMDERPFLIDDEGHVEWW
ncbi:MAG: hypothetical protein J5705_03795 [Bacteroidaceae bacterium]|nr:hypothetical protein [Bacteroidaceae bacterium]